MKAWIINFGNELLIGRVVNTNAAWIARELTLLGFEVRRIIVAPDDEEAIDVLREALAKADVIVCTGGLGPTPDDRTAEFVAKATGRKLVLNIQALKLVEEKYRSKGLPLTDERVKMAYLPEGATPIPNPIGTAPGIHLIVGKTHLFCLPGVPREMEAMFQSYVRNVLEKLVPKPCIIEASLVVHGIPESSIAPYIRKASRECGERCYVKSHPKGGELEQPVLDIRILASAPSCTEAEESVKRAFSILENAVKELKGFVEKKSITRLS